jgi:gamma-glutamylcyclotransferase (GGCT)/AIG2-like uncharacterized protein YtfP
LRYDTGRDDALRSLGVRILRFSNVDVLASTDAVVEEIYHALIAKPPPPPSPGVPGEGERAPAAGEVVDLLFVYGTLIPGLEPAVMSAEVRKLTPLGPATIQATLYDLGPYPGVILNQNDTVQGQLMRLASPDLWAKLDEYEGCPLPDSPDGLFQRVKTVATLSDGQKMACWVYIYTRPLDGAKRVQGGCWMTHRGRNRI